MICFHCAGDGTDVDAEDQVKVIVGVKAVQ